MVYFIIYMMQVLSMLEDIACVISLLSFAFILVLGLGCLMNIDSPYTPKVIKLVKILGITCCVSTLLALLTPSKTTLYQMGAVYLGKQVNKSMQVDTKIQKISTIMDLQLDKATKELTQNMK